MMAAQPRFSHARPGAGFASRIRQQTAGRFERLYIGQPGVFVVRRGIKRIDTGTCLLEAVPGEGIAMSGGGFADVTNIPDAQGVYAADVFCFGNGYPEQAMVRRGPGGRPLRHFAAFAAHSGLDGALQAAIAAVVNEPNIPDSVALHRCRELDLWLLAEGIGLQAASESNIAHRVRGLLAADLARPWRAADIAKALATSEPTLRRHLAGLNTSLTDILQDVRLSHGLQMLQGTDEPVTSIALGCGYQSPSQFARRFQQRFGMAPSAIRGRTAAIERNGAKIDQSAAAASAGAGYGGIAGA